MINSGVHFGPVGLFGSIGVSGVGVTSSGVTGIGVTVTSTLYSWLVVASESNVPFSGYPFSTTVYPLAFNALIVSVTDCPFVKAFPVSPVSTIDCATAPFSVLSVALLTSMKCVTATCDPSLTYTIVVSPVGVVGAGGTYPCFGSPSTFGFNGCPSGPTGVVPGTYGIVVVVVGSPGLDGSSLLFGYCGFSIVGGVNPSGTTGTNLPKALYTTLSVISLSVALTSVTSVLDFSTSPVATYPGTTGTVAFPSNVVSLFVATQSPYVNSNVLGSIVTGRLNSTLFITSSAAF